ncbi:MAG: hypothetical protein P8I78_01935 [Flavobacterium sp.]|nr:hypothetical protein [Flavobacterium sp.]
MYNLRRFKSSTVLIVITFALAVCSCNKSKNQAEKDLGTYDSPEEALRETKQALEKLSTNVNTGIESVLYVNEYDKSKNLIFKTTK